MNGKRCTPPRTLLSAAALLLLVAASASLGAFAAAYGTARIVFTLNPNLPYLVIEANLTDTGLSYTYTVVKPSVVLVGYSVVYEVEPLYAGVSITAKIYHGSSLMDVYRGIVQPVLYYNGPEYHDAIIYEFWLERGDTVPPGTNITLIATYSLNGASVTTLQPSVRWAWTSSGYTRVYLYRVDLLSYTSIKWPVWSTNMPFMPKKIEIVVNGTHEFINATQLNQVYDFGISVRYTSGSYVMVSMTCFWGCSDTCRSHFVVVEVYDAKTMKYLGSAGVSQYCPIRRTVYVNVSKNDIYLRIVVMSVKNGPEGAYWVLVPRPRIVNNPIALALFSLIVLGSAVTGMLRRSLREASISMIASSIVISLAAPYLGAYQYYSLYVAFGVLGFIIFAVTMLKGE